MEELAQEESVQCCLCRKTKEVSEMNMTNMHPMCNDCCADLGRYGSD